jgi:hypothetical protein
MADITKMITEGQTYQAAQEGSSDYEYWSGSLFEWFRRIASPKAKGSKGERMVADILEALGADVPRDKTGKPTKPKGSGTQFDIFPDQIKTEVKTSSAWEGTDFGWTWQQIRAMQDYERLVCLGINANGAYAWWCTKEDLEKHIFGRNEFRQHGGSTGKQDLYWISTPGGDTAEVPTFFRSMDTWND